MLKKKQLYEEIDRYLSSLQAYIRMQNKSGTFDINTYCEDFIGDLLNIVFDLDLKNLNSIQKNYPAIDLGDENAGICIQVTATNSSQKIKHTLDKFKKNKLYEKYNEINIFILGEKKNYSNSDFAYSEFDFDQDKDILDFSTLSVTIKNIKNNLKLNEILTLLKENVNTVDNSNQRSLLDKIKKIEVKQGKSYEKFITEYFQMDINSQEAIDTKNDIEYLGDILVKLNKSTREVIVGICNRATSFKPYEGVYFNKYDLEKYLNVSPQELYEEMKILIQKRYVDVSEDSGDEYDELSIYDEGKNWEMISNVLKFCKKYKRDISRIILDLDFTEFD